MQSQYTMSYANLNLHRLADGKMGGPRDQRLAQSIVDLQALLDILGGKSQSLPDQMLECYQHRVNVLTTQIQETLANEGIAYTRPGDSPCGVTLYRS